jgi:hypothetical protein
MRLPSRRAGGIALVIGACTLSPCIAQDLEPRRWTHLPVGTSVFAVAGAYTTGDLKFDPVLRIEDAQVDLYTAVLGYTRYFGLGERTARIDVLVPLQTGTWDGLVDGVPRSVTRDGLADPSVRLSMNVFGAPAVSGEEFRAYRAQHPVATTLGVALELRLPFGEYKEDKLINLGNNRFAIGPQAGILHTRGEWSYELTSSMTFFTDNDEFFGGHELEQDPLGLVQSHVVKTFGTDWWVAAGASYAWAGESTIDGDAKGDDKSTLTVGTSCGCRLGAAQSLRVGYAHTDTLTDTGIDAHSVAIAWSIRL